MVEFGHKVDRTAAAVVVHKVVVVAVHMVAVAVAVVGPIGSAVDMAAEAAAVHTVVGSLTDSIDSVALVRKGTVDKETVAAVQVVVERVDYNPTAL